MPEIVREVIDEIISLMDIKPDPKTVADAVSKIESASELILIAIDHDGHIRVIQWDYDIPNKDMRGFVFSHVWLFYAPDIGTIELISITNVNLILTKWNLRRQRVKPAGG
jgi:hypothetical protein